jgi:hypothetical protein
MPKRFLTTACAARVIPKRISLGIRGWRSHPPLRRSGQVNGSHTAIPTTMALRPFGVRSYPQDHLGAGGCKKIGVTEAVIPGRPPRARAFNWITAS